MNRAAFALALVASLTTGVAALASPKKKVVVHDLSAQGVEPHEALALSSAACHAFADAAKGYEVLCGEDLRIMMRFGAMSAAFSSCAEQDCYTNLGKAMEARYVVSGSVSRLDEQSYVLSLALIDTESSSVLGRTEVKADSLGKLHAQVKEASSAILAKR